MGEQKEAAKASNGLSLWLTQDVYRPGDRIEGRLKAQVSQRTTVRAARVKVREPTALGPWR